METIRTGRELLLLLLLSSSTVCFGDDQSEKAHNHFRQGLAYQQEGKFNEAIAEYEQSAALEPTSGNAMFNLGLIYFKQQRWPQAIEAFQRASELDPEDGGAHFHLAATYAASGTDPQAAVEHYDRSQALGYQGDPRLGEWLLPLRNTNIDLEYEPTLYKSSGKVQIHISGNPKGEQLLERDVIRMIEISEHGSSRPLFDAIEAQFVRQEGDRTWFERWTIKSKDVVSGAYEVRFDLSPKGGTDFAVTQLR